MHRSRSIALVFATLLIAACGETETEFAQVSVVRGAPIDGSGDAGVGSLAKPKPVAQPEVVAVAPIESTDTGAVAGTGTGSLVESDVPPGADATEPVAAETSAADLTAEPADPEAAASTDVTGGEDADAAARPEPRKAFEPDEAGVYHLAFSDLSLEGEDVDNIIDYLLFPDEFEEGEGFQFPDHLKALDGKEITISGYMIPGRIRKNMVKDFMLVRDLAGCCFGGAPNPDEWIDVVMEGDAEAEYLRYLPIKVRGKLTLIGEQDQEGYAVGVYRMKATWAGEED